MNRDKLRLPMIAAAGLLSLAPAGIAPPVLAHSHHSMHTHLHHSGVRPAGYLNKSAQLCMASNFAGPRAAMMLDRQLNQVQTKISHLDNLLIESLGRLTEYQDLQFEDPANSQKYATDIASERQNVERYEDYLATALEHRDKIKAQINERIEEHPIQNVSAAAAQ